MSTRPTGDVLLTGVTDVRPRVLTVAVASLSAATIALAAPGSTGAAQPRPGAALNDPARQSSSVTTLTIGAADGENWPCSFNPFNPNTYYFSLGITNEELYYVDTLTGKMTPWLATAYKWSNHDTVLTFSVRKGVKWSNGQPLTAADVAFTFNLIKNNPSLDLNSIGSFLTSVKQTGQYQVVMKFNQPAVTDFYYIADQVSIVPESVWKSIRHPLTYPDSNPVGTGPYLVSHCSPQNIEYVKNPHYWQPGKPKFDKVELPAILTNSVANEDLANGTAQWGGQSIPNIQSFYLSRNKAYRAWFPAVGVNGLYINLKAPLLSNVAVRQAMAYGVDRKKIAVLAEFNEQPAANQAAVLLPMQKQWLNAALYKKYNYTYDPAKAVSVLEKAGFKRGSDGIFRSPSGQELSFTVADVGAYSDQVASVGIFASEMRQIGIKLAQQNLSTPAMSSELASGHFQIAYGGPPQLSVDGPYGILRGILYSPSAVPVGKTAASDYERFYSPHENALFAQLGHTTNVAMEESIIKQLEVPMLQDVPFIPLTEATGQDEYNTSYASGWPTPSNPYANPSPTTQPDEGVVLLNLVPKKA
jgi:peptide/nickel transport system substrate-binding protein